MADGPDGIGRIGKWERREKEQEMIEIRMPVKIVSVANLRLHWAVKAKLAKSHRSKAFSAFDWQVVFI